MQPTELRSPQSKIHWPSALQFGLCTLAAVVLLGLALLTTLIGFGQLMGGPSTSGDATSTFLLAAGIALTGVLVLPSVVLSLLRLLGRPEPTSQWLVHLSKGILTFLILAFILALLIGGSVSGNSSLSWLIMPPIQALVVGLPVLFLVYLAVHGLPRGSSQRTWGVFDSGLVITPTLIIILELGALIVFGLVGLIIIANQPDLIREFQRLAQSFQNGTPPPGEVLRLISPYLESPGFIFAAFVFMAVVVPLIEELIKPAGVWLLAGRHLTPAEGFVAGVLSGAGYALVENLGATTSMDSWAFLVLVRACTGVMHIFTAGLMGWAIVTAWNQRRYLRLGVAYLTAVVIHGLWNGLALFVGVASLPPLPQPISIFTSQREIPAILGMVVLIVIVFILLVWSNRALRRAIIPQLQSPGITPGPVPQDHIP